MKQNHLLLAVCIIVLMGLLFAAWQSGLYPQTPSTHLASPSPTVAAPATGPIIVSGTMVCLPHKNTSGPQTLECAFGLQDLEGRYYGLRDTDPSYKNVSGAPMNELVTVEGTFTAQNDSIYQSVGVIEVSKITLGN